MSDLSGTRVQIRAAIRRGTFICPGDHLATTDTYRGCQLETLDVVLLNT